MSFLSELKKQKNRLKETETVVKNVDGRRFIERGDVTETLPSSHGFVVDTKPDDIPVLVSQYLYIGSQDCATSKVLDSYNIKYVLSVGIDVDVTDVTHKHVHCLDLPETDIRIVLKDCLPFIKKAVESKENVLVHCNAGVSRTSMVAIAYLMHYQKLRFEKAYNLIKERRPVIQPNTGFKNQLKAMVPGEII